MAKRLKLLLNYEQTKNKIAAPSFEILFLPFHRLLIFSDQTKTTTLNCIYRAKDCVNCLILANCKNQ